MTRIKKEWEVNGFFSKQLLDIKIIVISVFTSPMQTDHQIHLAATPYKITRNNHL